MVNTDFGGDNHQDAGLLTETNQTLAMIAALDTYWKSIHEFGVADDDLFANLDVFGRDPGSDGNGRSHYGEFVNGLMIGKHLSGGVVGGYAMEGRHATDHRRAHRPTQTLPPIRRSQPTGTIMGTSGVTSERQEAGPLGHARHLGDTIGTRSVRS